MREYPDEPPEHQLETPSRVLGRKVGDGRLGSDDELQFGYEVRDEPSIWAERLAERVPPGRQVGFTRSQKAPDEALERLRERRIWDVALVLIEFARREQPAGWNQRFMEFINDRGFTDTGVAG